MEEFTEYQQSELKREYQKLADLEYEYNLLESQSDDKILIAVAKAKYNNQLKYFENLVDNIEEIK